MAHVFHHTDDFDDVCEGDGVGSVSRDEGGMEVVRSEEKLERSADV